MYQRKKKTFFVVLILYIKTTLNHVSFNNVNKRSMYIVHIFELYYIIFKHFRKQLNFASELHFPLQFDLIKF